MKAPIKLCSFDITNTLLKFRMSVGEQYTKVGKVYGVERDPVKISEAFRHHWKEMNELHPNYGRRTGNTAQWWWKGMVERVFNHNASKITDDQLDNISSHLYELYKDGTCWDVAKGAKDLLKDLRDRHLTLGVISNFDERLGAVLSSTGLATYFDFVLASYVIRVAKPSRKIFDCALRYFPELEPGESVHVGDDVELDYLAAKEAGWNALLLVNPNKDHNVSKYVNKEDIVYNVEEIKQIIKKNL